MCPMGRLTLGKNKNTNGMEEAELGMLSAVSSNQRDHGEGWRDRPGMLLCPVVLKLRVLSASPGGLVKTDCWVLPPEFDLVSMEWGPRTCISNNSQAWNYSWRITGLEMKSSIS